MALFKSSVKVNTSYKSSSHGLLHILFKQPPIASKNLCSICGEMNSNIF